MFFFLGGFLEKMLQPAPKSIVLWMLKKKPHNSASLGKLQLNMHFFVD